MNQILLKLQTWAVFRKTIVVQRKDEKGLYQRSISTTAKHTGIPIKLITSFPT